jgi:hypothetical protein
MLVHAEPDARDEAESAPARSRGRGLLSGFGESRRFDREMRAAGDWSGYDQPLAARVMAFRTAASAVVAVAFLAFVWPWGAQSRSWVGDRLAGLLPHSYEEIKVEKVSVDPPQPDIDGYAADFAVDGFRNRAWVTAWDPAQPIGRDCRETVGRRSATLVLDFAKEVRVDRVSIRAGLDEKNPDHNTQARPKRFGLQLGDKSCQTLPLKPGPDRQDFDVEKAGEVSYAKVWIIDADEPADGPGNRVAISELDFLTAR